MKILIATACLLITITLSAQTVNEVALYTRPVKIHSGYTNALRTSTNIYLGGNRKLYGFKNNNAISGGIYTGFTAQEQLIKQSWKHLYYDNKLAYNFTLGLKASYIFYASKNNKLNLHFSFLGEVVWSEGIETYRNFSDNGFYIWGKETIDNYLQAGETKQVTYTLTKFNLLSELGLTQTIYKGVGLSASALWNIHTNDFIGSAGLNYRF